MNKFSLMVLTVLLISTVSCKKDEPPCNCGAIVEDGITDDCNWLDIKNDCTGNVQRFCFDINTWMNAPVGTNFCVTNQTKW